MLLLLLVVDCCCVAVASHRIVRPTSLLRLCQLRFVDSNFRGKSPMDMRCPPLKLEILLESNPLKSRILVRRLAASRLIVSYRITARHGTARRIASVHFTSLDFRCAPLHSGPFRLLCLFRLFVCFFVRLLGALVALRGAVR